MMSPSGFPIAGTTLLAGGVYVRKALCGPHPARSLFSKKRRSRFFGMREPYYHE